MSSNQSYYVPESSIWPIVGSIGMFLTFFGLSTLLVNQSNGDPTTTAWVVFTIGALVLIYMITGWLRDVIRESRAGLYDAQMDRSFRQGMSWFIFSEVAFFAALFGSLFYIRFFAVPWLGGEGAKGTANMLWEGFQAQWPLLSNPDNSQFAGPDSVIGPWGLPLLNTLILVTSSITLTLSHKALKYDKRKQTIYWLAATVALGAIFLFFQIEEYIEAYSHLNLTLDSGIYGSIFFLMTGFHGLHVLLGGIILFVVLMRLIKGHFSAHDHFGYEAGAWYWHFVDVVWIMLFVFVYVI
ncbi:MULTISPECIES: cytochrome c oxidase subunit 3 [Gammaproteobacteria]|jgi:cytochrome c oxidase subunit 3|uniref:cytochrome-c oxidase n=1 Tax=Vreelandella halophila TaxID=86177 RepID=A0A9X4YBB6_9GAMM|nr:MULTISPECIES: cytochrome c oxidase subunit 3 [Gammaproteobacteria]KAA8982946.1 cytochrome c oxidase subunit 3 [Halospina sp. K52047b]MYL25883.1 cytochrome c oxidase subunit 3 [Halomonas utahensis]MYL73555.1 cytochrome c oxidase subunit 3 [Halomonas sp. 22501_18_FS]